MLTHRQRECLECIVRHQAEHGGMSPLFTDIMSAIGGSKSSTHGLLCQLERRGFISRRPMLTRAITVLRQPPPKREYFVFNFDSKELQPCLNHRLV